MKYCHSQSCIFSTVLLTVNWCSLCCGLHVLVSTASYNEPANDSSASLSPPLQSWSGVILPVSPEEPWPVKRSFHAACALVDPACISPRESQQASPTLPPWHPEFAGPNLDWLPCPPPTLSPPEKVEEECRYLEPRLFVLWGMDNNADPISDAWIFNVNSLTWKQVWRDVYTLQDSY